MKKYKVDLNWYGELYTQWTHSSSTEAALGHATHELATKLNKTHYNVRQYFSSKPTSYSVKEIPTSITVK